MKTIKYEAMTSEQKKFHDAWIRLSPEYGERFAKAMAKQLGFCIRGDCENKHKPGDPLILEGSKLVCHQHAFERLRELASAPLSPKKAKPNKKRNEDEWREVSLL